MVILISLVKLPQAMDVQYVVLQLKCIYDPYLGQRSDAGHSHVTHTNKAGGYSDEVWSRSLKPRLSYGQLCHFTVKMDI